MRQLPLECEAFRASMRRISNWDVRSGCRGTCLSCRCMGLLGRALRTKVGVDRGVVEAYIDRFLAARRMPVARRRFVRAIVLSELAKHGLWAKDGWLLFDDNTGRLSFSKTRRQA